MAVTVEFVESIIDLTRPAVYTFAEGNIARHADVIQHIPTGSTVAQINRPYNADGETVGITASFTSSSNGANDRFFPTMNNGLLVGQTQTGIINSNWNTFGLNSGPVFVILRWNDIFVIDSTRVMWWYDSTSGTGGVSLPAAGTGDLAETSTNRTTIQYWNQANARWENVSNLRDASGADVLNIGVAGGGTGATNRIWNGVIFDPVTTDRVRLVVQKGIGNGIGIGQWEVFSVEDPAVSDLGAISADMFQNMTGSVTLPTMGHNGSVITWSDSTSSALTTEGVVTRPAADQPNAVGTITATAVHPDGTASRTFNFTVLREIPVAETPNITAQPAARVTIDADNQSATLSVTASVTDGGTLSYQWYKIDNDSRLGVPATAIPGATEATYSVPINEGGTFYYYVRVTNRNDLADSPFATATSITSEVTIIPSIISIEINPVNNLNPILQPGTGSRTNDRLRSFFRYKTENTFLRPGESVTYNHITKAIGMDPNPAWSIHRRRRRNGHRPRYRPADGRRSSARGRHHRNSQDWRIIRIGDCNRQDRFRQEWL